MHSFWLAQVSQPLLEKMFEQLRAGGSTVESFILDPVGSYPAWKVQGSGIIAQVAYDRINQRALVTILSKPFLAPVSYIESEVRKSLREARNSLA